MYHFALRDFNKNNVSVMFVFSLKPKTMKSFLIEKKTISTSIFNEEFFNFALFYFK